MRTCKTIRRKVIATLTCSIRYIGNVFSSLSFHLLFLHLVISLGWIACGAYEKCCAASLATLWICTCWMKKWRCCTCQPVSWRCNIFYVSVSGVNRHVLLGGTIKPRWASENCYTNIQAYVDEMHNHDTKDHIGEQSPSHQIVARSVCAFGLGGERANISTLQEETILVYWLTKFHHKMSVITHSIILQSPASPKTSPFR